MDVGTAGYVGDPHSLLGGEGKDLLESLPEIGSHEGIDQGVDAGVGVRHAVRPDLDLIGVVVALESWAKDLEEDEDLHRAPADSEEDHNDCHHAGDLGSHGF